MGDILPDGSIQGYFGICPKCKATISTNMQGNELGNHRCILEINLDKLKKLDKKVDELLDNITPEDIEKYFPPDTTPKGWVSINDHLPHWLAEDFLQGYTVYKVKYHSGKESETRVCDHDSWYVDAVLQGITHWWNE